MPVLIVLGGAESIVSNQAAEEFRAPGEDCRAISAFPARATKS